MAAACTQTFVLHNQNAEWQQLCFKRDLSAPRLAACFQLTVDLISLEVCWTVSYLRLLHNCSAATISKTNAKNDFFLFSSSQELTLFSAFIRALNWLTFEQEGTHCWCSWAEGRIILLTLPWQNGRPHLWGM